MCCFWQTQVQPMRQPDKLDTADQEKMSSKGRVHTFYINTSLFLLPFLLPLKNATGLIPSHLRFPIEMRKERKKINWSLHSVDLKLYLRSGKLINISSPTEESFWEILLSVKQQSSHYKIFGFQIINLQITCNNVEFVFPIAPAFPYQMTGLTS